MERMIEYLMQQYQPLAILTYGSYADGSNNDNSDYDALVITANHQKFHDTSVVYGTQLDVFVYPLRFFEEAYDCESFVQLFDSKIVMDTDGCAAKVKSNVVRYIDSMPKKTRTELADELAWCRKMLLRAKRQDAEGMYRLHWLLIDSLEIFCDIVGHPYFGPKKSLRWMELQYPNAFSFYEKALSDHRQPTCEKWIDCMENCLRGD